VSGQAPDADAWEPFMQDILTLPMSMLPDVQWAVKANIWRRAYNPLQQVKDTATRREARLLQAKARLY
jgi:hypothetical protein